MSTSLSELLKILEDLAPTRYAEAWDNVGLLAGDPAQTISRAMLAIDYTADVAAEARTEECDLVIAYHPPIFEGLKRICSGSVIYDAIRRGVAIYSPHTALDVAEGGTNDMLADALGLSDRAPLRPATPPPAALKLVVFTPAEAVERVSEALFAAGAGRIGNYSCCSFRAPGTGSFFGESAANPAVGEAGRLEYADELRLEMILPITRAAQAIAAMRRVHPYEEPAFDLIQLAAPPEGKGQGRIGRVEPAVERPALFDQLKQMLGIAHLLIAGPTTGPVSRAACCAGACGELVNDALAQQADLYLTGELRHHDAIKATARGMTVVCTLHSNSERAVLKRLSEKLAERAPTVHSQVSRADRDPFSIA